MSAGARKKASLPSLPKLMDYWWTYVDGEPRLETELFPAWHAGKIRWESRDGRSPVCFGCLMSTGEGGGTSIWMHRGHLVAEVHGGPSDPSNLVPICARCNADMPRFTDREEAASWLTERQRWCDYLAEIDAVTPRRVDNSAVIGDAAWGRTWSPRRFVLEFPMSDSDREIAACLFIAHEAQKLGGLSEEQASRVRRSGEFLLGELA